MKSFFKAVMANIVAILIIFGIFTFGFIFLIMISALSGKGSTNVKDNSVLVLNLKDNVVETENEVSPSMFALNEEKVLRLSDILDAIQQAKTDSKIKGISIESDNISAGITQIDDIRKALEDFKSSGKFVYAYGNTVSQSAYYLSSVSEQYFLHPAGGVELKGLSSEVVFLKDFFDKLGIGVDVLRHGKYKSAVEPFLTNKISDENKEQLTFMLGDLWKNISTKMMTSRKMDSLQFNNTVDSLYGIIPDLALQHKLVDRLSQKTEYENFIKAKMKTPTKDDLNKVSIKKYIQSLNDTSSSSDSNNQVAVLYASGEIMSGKGISGIYSEDIIKEIKKLVDDNKVKSVVLRINSPGGSANASDEILFELQQLRAKKPLVVSFGDYAASGGYYIAMAGQRIFSEPNTLTGSIGVFGMIYNAKDLAARYGLRSDIVKTNENANMFSTINGISEGTKNMMQKSVEQTYKRFVHFVSKNRNKTFEQIDEVGSGHVWSGTRAKEIGLVDELGSLNDAIRYAGKLAKLKDYSIKSYPKEKSSMERFMENFSEEDIAAKALELKFGKENYQLLQRVFNTPSKEVQMALPYHIKID
ncbi:signal peptide peptidase SppA [Elizabethkingia sp. JS20170427COW]|uniref:signal peptide peptidase SppA n=1 Tax=Elizabethkingia sp. JS20170427COW TaxID=2583851 RepID=UPI00111032EE|nr:signal peptide peptidase SppA [Elizabethkingia sp. JS20170427COW]QCX53467.1 signal peptide peptidase SppA [Elizabethkingia sp. JS20170427COW]